MVLKKDWTTSSGESSREFLRGLMRPGDLVYVIPKYTSRDGGRHIVDVFKVWKGAAIKLSPVVSTLLDMPYSKEYGGVVVECWEMDAAEKLVGELSDELFRSGSKRLRYTWF